MNESGASKDIRQLYSSCADNCCLGDCNKERFYLLLLIYAYCCCCYVVCGVIKYAFSFEITRAVFVAAFISTTIQCPLIGSRSFNIEDNPAEAEGEEL